MTKGELVRLYLGSDNTATPAKVIAAAKQLSLHISCSVESSTTKDTVGDWDFQEVTAVNFDISTTALVRSGETITASVNGQNLNDLEAIYEAGTPVKFQIANVSGANNRTKGPVIISGSVVLTQLSINAQNRQKADYSASLAGWGEFSVGS